MKTLKLQCVYRIGALSFLLFLVWIIYLANTKQPSIFFDLVRVIPYGDKVGHFLLFGFFSFVLNFAFKLNSFKIGRMPIFIGSTICIAFAFVEEFTQLFIVSRTFDLIDLAVGLIGIIVFNILTHYIKQQIEKNHRDM